MKCHRVSVSRVYAKGTHRKRSSPPTPHSSPARRLSAPGIGLKCGFCSKAQTAQKPRKNLHGPPWVQAFLRPLSLQLGSFVMHLANTHTHISAPLFLPRTQRRARINQPGFLPCRRCVESSRSTQCQKF